MDARFDQFCRKKVRTARVDVGFVRIDVQNEGLWNPQAGQVWRLAYLRQVRVSLPESNNKVGHRAQVGIRRVGGMPAERGHSGRRVH